MITTNILAELVAVAVADCNSQIFVIQWCQELFLFHGLKHSCNIFVGDTSALWDSLILSQVIKLHVDFPLLIVEFI
jgi:hypothetical protein